jgi:hypothetical protein
VIFQLASISSGYKSTEMRVIPLDEFEIDLDRLKMEEELESASGTILLASILIVGGFVLLMSARKSI